MTRPKTFDDSVHDEMVRLLTDENVPLDSVPWLLRQFVENRTEHMTPKLDEYASRYRRGEIERLGKERE